MLNKNLIVEKVIIERIRSKAPLEKCAEILVKAFNQAYGDEWTKSQALVKLNTFYNSPKFMGWVAKQNENIVGACIGNIEPYFTGDYFYLKEIFILPKYQGKGIGNNMMQIIKEELKEMDIKMMILFTVNEGHQYKFYLDNDFEEMEGMRMLIYDKSRT